MSTARRCPNTTKITWSGALDRLKESGASLYDALKLVDANPIQKAIYLLRYPFGHEIVNNGVFQMPCVGAFCTECSAVRQAILRRTKGPDRSIPFCVVTLGSCEVYQTMTLPSPVLVAGSLTYPLAVIGRGEPFGVFETAERLQQSSDFAPWSVSAGLRSIHLVTSLKGDWNLWQRLSTRSSREAHKWHCELVVIPDELFSAEVSRLHLFETAWRDSAGIRRQVALPLRRPLRIHDAGDDITMAATDEIFKHLLHVADGERPAFVPVDTSSDEYGPLQWKQLRIIEHEGSRLKGFPHILGPRMLRKSGEVGMVPLAADPKEMKSIPAAFAHLRRSIPTAIERVMASKRVDFAFICREHLPDTPRTKTQWTKEALVQLTQRFQIPAWVKGITATGVDVNAKVLNGIVQITIEVAPLFCTA